MRLYRASRRAGDDVRKDFRRHLKNAAQIGADAAKLRARAITGAPSGSQTHWQHGRHGRHGRMGTRSLGAVLASNIRVSVKGDDIRIVQGATGISGRNARGLPRGMDEFTGFTHPVFGHTPEVQQAGHPYFQRTMIEKRGAMEREVAHVLDDIERRLT